MLCCAVRAEGTGSLLSLPDWAHAASANFVQCWLRFRILFFCSLLCFIVCIMHRYTRKLRLRFGAATLLPCKPVDGCGFHQGMESMVPGC